MSKSRSHELGIDVFFIRKKTTKYIRNTDCLIWYKQIHIETTLQKILYSFLETCFLTNENPTEVPFVTPVHKDLFSK